MLVHVDTTGDRRNPIGSLADLDMIVCSGFGQAHITCDGEVILDGDPDPIYYIHKGKRVRTRCLVALRSHRVMRDGWLTIRRVERYLEHRARSGAPLNGRIECFILAPLWDATWWRRAPGEWVCTHAGEGFA